MRLSLGPTWCLVWTFNWIILHDSVTFADHCSILVHGEVKFITSFRRHNWMANASFAAAIVFLLLHDQKESHQFVSLAKFTRRQPLQQRSYRFTTSTICLKTPLCHCARRKHQHYLSCYFLGKWRKRQMERLILCVSDEYDQSCAFLVL
jgi:hypothetical protein